MGVAKDLGLDQLPYITLAFDIETALLQLGYSNMFMNVAAGMSALLCDQHFSPKQ